MQQTDQCSFHKSKLTSKRYIAQIHITFHKYFKLYHQEKLHNLFLSIRQKNKEMNFLSYVPPSAYDSMLSKPVTTSEVANTKASSIGSSNCSSDTSFGSRAAIEQQLIRRNFKLMLEHHCVACAHGDRLRAPF